MVYREVSVIEVREVLRVWLAGHGVRRTAELAGVDRKTVRRYVEAAQAAGLTQQSAPDALDDGLVGAVVSAGSAGRLRDGVGRAVRARNRSGPGCAAG